MVIFSVKSIKADKDPIYPKDSVGRKFENELMAISENDEAGEMRFQNMKKDSDLIKSKRFKEIISNEENKNTKLRAACNVAYLMKGKGDDAGRPPSNVNESEQDEYWEDVGKGCSVSGGHQKPNKTGNNKN